jgi:hypothetical protein
MVTPDAALPKPEFSRPVAVAALRQGGEVITLTATAAEAAALAARFGIDGVRSLTATLRLIPKAKGEVSVRGHVRALLDRRCVVSLDPIEEAIDEPIAVLFRPATATEQDVALHVDREEDEEPYAGGDIDLGEHVAQTLALALDPWPRAPGASLPPELSG